MLVWTEPSLPNNLSCQAMPSKTSTHQQWRQLFVHAPLLRHPCRVCESAKGKDQQKSDMQAFLLGLVHFLKQLPLF